VCHSPSCPASGVAQSPCERRRSPPAVLYEGHTLSLRTAIVCSYRDSPHEQENESAHSVAPSHRVRRRRVAAGGGGAVKTVLGVRRLRRVRGRRRCRQRDASNTTRPQVRALVQARGARRWLVRWRVAGMDGWALGRGAASVAVVARVEAAGRCCRDKIQL
jgi:hypothetical protein